MSVYYDGGWVCSSAYHKKQHDGGTAGTSSACVGCRTPTAGLREAAVAGVSVLPDRAVTRGRLQLIAEYPELVCRYEALAPLRDSTRARLVRSIPRDDVAGYLRAALIGSTFALTRRYRILRLLAVIQRQGNRRFAAAISPPLRCDEAASDLDPRRLVSLLFNKTYRNFGCCQL